MIRGRFLKWSRSFKSCKCDISCQTLVPDFNTSFFEPIYNRQQPSQEDDSIGLDCENLNFSSTGTETVERTPAHYVARASLSCTAEPP